MARFVLKFEDHVLKECALGLIATIGRLPDNSIVIENPAVSGHHACVFRDGDQFVVEDLESTNGTFVNERRVTRHTLRGGDVLLVGKHELVFDPVGGEEPVEREASAAAISNLGDTVLLDTSKHRMLLARIRDGEAAPEAAQAAPAGLGVLRVLDGRADRSEYHLEARTSLIGRAKTNAVRMRGWFKPRVAAAITRNGHAYIATLLAGTLSINDKAVSGRCEVHDGDILRVSGLTLEFRQKG
jgi:hypothetical protein